MFRDQSQDNYGDQNFTNTYINDQLINSIKSVITTGSDYDNITTNINYTGLFNEQKGQELTFNGDYAYYDITSRNSQDNNVVSGTGISEIFKQNSQQYINLFSGRVDYQQSFWKTGVLETGLKWAMTQTDNDLNREDFLNNIWQPNTNMSNQFLYTSILQLLMLQWAEC
jgi:hypothetical protein